MGTMSRLLTILLLPLILNACAGLKPLIPIDPSRKAAVLENCGRPFLAGSHRLVHALELSETGGAKTTAIGILVADPWTRYFRTVMMTIEGWVLLDAEASRTLTLHRAVPPFNEPSFATSLSEDLLLAFFPPGDEPDAWGEGERGATVCRYGCADGRTVEVVAAPEGAVEIHLYDTGRRLQKRVTMDRPPRNGLADSLEIRNRWPPYTLRLRLLESEPLEGGSGNTSWTRDPSDPSGAADRNGLSESAP